MQAQVVFISEHVTKEGRKDTEFKPLTTNTPLLEGESLRAENGSATILFPNITLIMKPHTQLDFLTALPTNLVVRQPSGTITYIVSQTIKPFSIRSLGLLTQITNKATLTITTNATTQTVLVKITTGEATLAYSDSQNTTRVQKILSGQQAFFDYNESTLTMQ